MLKGKNSTIDKWGTEEDNTVGDIYSKIPHTHFLNSLQRLK